MSSTLTKLAKVRAQAEELEKEAAKEAANIVMETGAYEIPATLLKRLLKAAAKAPKEKIETSITHLCEKSSG